MVVLARLGRPTWKKFVGGVRTVVRILAVQGPHTNECHIPDSHRAPAKALNEAAALPKLNGGLTSAPAPHFPAAPATYNTNPERLLHTTFDFRSPILDSGYTLLSLINNSLGISRPMAELNPALYTVAWIAPLEIEAKAALYMLDNKHSGRFSVARGDDYVYHAGDISGHNIIIATLPAGQEYGTGSAAALASQVKKFFPNLWFGLLVGVAAGLPNISGTKPQDIRLGDVLVALPEGDGAGLVAYDLGKETGEDGLKLLRMGHVLATTEPIVRSAIGSIKLNAPNDTDIFLPYYNNIKDMEHIEGTFTDPGQAKDILYKVDQDGVEQVVARERRPDMRRTRVWYGPIGSGEKLMKDARKRNELRDRYNIIGLEMEAAGTMNRIPVGVIRGVCDYGDERKNKEWQPYAAAMAAAYAKAILLEIPPSKLPVIDSQQVRGHSFTGPISGRNVFAGMSTSGGTVNLNFS